MRVTVAWRWRVGGAVLVGRSLPEPVRFLRPPSFSPTLPSPPSSCIIVGPPSNGTMTLPANDAFTLGLPHDPARIGLRSSTKIPFVSGTKARSPSATSRRSLPPRQMSVDLTDSSAPRDSRSPPPRPTLSPVHNGSPNGAPLRQRKKPRKLSATSSHLVTQPKDSKSSRPPVDWEIPRKTLHSSIGLFTLFSSCRVTSTSLIPPPTPSRLPYPLSLRLQWKPPHRHLYPQPCPRSHRSCRHPKIQLRPLRMAIRARRRFSYAGIRESTSFMLYFPSSPP